MLDLRIEGPFPPLCGCRSSKGRSSAVNLQFVHHQRSFIQPSRALNASISTNRRAAILYPPHKAFVNIGSRSLFLTLNGSSLMKENMTLMNYVT